MIDELALHYIHRPVTLSAQLRHQDTVVAEQDVRFLPREMWCFSSAPASLATFVDLKQPLASEIARRNNYCRKTALSEQGQTALDVAQVYVCLRDRYNINCQTRMDRDPSGALHVTPLHRMIANPRGSYSLLDAALIFAHALPVSIIDQEVVILLIRSQQAVDHNPDAILIFTAKRDHLLCEDVVFYERDVVEDNLAHGVLFDPRGICCANPLSWQVSQSVALDTWRNGSLSVGVAIRQAHHCEVPPVTDQSLFDEAAFEAERRAVALASSNNQCLSSLYLLSILLDDWAGDAGCWLRSLASSPVEPNRWAEQLRRELPLSQPPPHPSPAAFINWLGTTAEYNNVLNAAKDIAQRCYSPAVSPSHLLVAMLDIDCSASRWLKQVSGPIDSIRRTVSGYHKPDPESVLQKL